MITQGNLGLHLDQYPSGRWGFSGSVPGILAYTDKAGNPVSDEFIKRQLMLPGSPKIRQIVTRTWETKEDALKAATELGFKVRGETE